MPLVRFETRDAVAVITLDRPKVNALSVDLIDELVGAIERAGSSEIRAVVVTGSPHFAAGADITAFKEAMTAGGSPSDLGLRLAEACDLLEELPKPVIAAVHGFALGGGLELAMACDIRILADDARVGQPEIRLGIIPGAGGTQRLPRLVGIARAREMIYSGRMVDADEAAAIGLADRVVPAGDLLDAALAEAGEWAKGPTRALGAAKRALNRGLGMALRDGLAVEAAGFAEVFDTEDAAEGIDAFLEKREPHFRGN
jgi:enoyl-CoA hydratase/carnithine racemase